MIISSKNSSAPKNRQDVRMQARNLKKKKYQERKNDKAENRKVKLKRFSDKKKKEKKSGKSAIFIRIRHKPVFSEDKIEGN